MSYKGFPFHTPIRRQCISQHISDRRVDRPMRPTKQRVESTVENMEILNDYLLDFVYFRILRQSEGLIPVALGRKT